MGSYSEYELNIFLKEYVGSDYNTITNIFKLLKSDYIEFNKVYSEKSYENRPKPEDFNHDNLYRLFSKNRLTDILINKVKSEAYQKKLKQFSPGSGNLPYFCYIGVCDNKLCGPKEDFYIVYLFNKDLSKVFLTLELGSTNKYNFEYLKKFENFELNEAKNKFKENIEENKQVFFDNLGLDLDKFNDGIFLGRFNEKNLIKKNEDAEKYENGSIFVKAYDIDDLPSEKVLIQDFNDFISLYYSILSEFGDEEMTDLDETNKEFDEDLESKRLDCGKNTLIYGVPGVGKSWAINEIKCKNIDENHKERIVFHQDYTYSDFVGQILPKVSEKSVEYEFVPGPFTNILKKSYKNPSEKYVLIIEEINRGNAPAIFGDIFQLLDRMKKQKDIFKKGTSEFGITNSEIAGEVYNNKEHKVRIPSNLSIIATMNTSDQNVFTLDTAFKRRWHMEMIKNDFDDPSFSGDFVPKSEITWKVFGTAINEIILEESNSTLSSEDKRLGAYFVNEEELKSPKEFAEKVLMYLWDDVFKFSREDYFNKESVNQFCLESIIDEFMNNKEKDKFKIFTNRINDKIKEVKERLSNDKEEND